MVNVCVQHFDAYKLPKSKLTNANILWLWYIRFGSGRNKLVQLLIRSRNSGSRTIRSLTTTASSLSLLQIQTACWLCCTTIPPLTQQANQCSKTHYSGQRRTPSGIIVASLWLWNCIQMFYLLTYVLIPH